MLKLSMQDFRHDITRVAVNMSANLETQQSPQDWKQSIPIPIPKKGSTKEFVNLRTIALISHLVFLVAQMVKNPPAM